MHVNITKQMPGRDAFRRARPDWSLRGFHYQQWGDMPCPRGVPLLHPSVGNTINPLQTRFVSVHKCTCTGAMFRSLATTQWQRKILGRLTMAVGHRHGFAADHYAGTGFLVIL